MKNNNLTLPNKLACVFLCLCSLLISACAATSNNNDMLLGEVTAETLLQQSPKFNRQYQEYSFSDEIIDQANQLGEDTSIKVFFGQWCHDSEREVPRLLKLFKENRQVNIKLIALDYSKSDDLGLAKVAGVKYTPTIIVYRNDTEVGRIIERPIGANLWADISKM